MKDWQEFVSRTPEEYERWIYQSSREVAEFEVTEPIRISQSKKVLEYCGFEFDEIKNLEVHIEKKRYDFAIYKYEFNRP